MTYNTKNATIVFALTALLMVMPLAGQQANGDGTAILTAACGFNEVNADSFGTLTRGAASVTEQTVTFTPTASSTGTGTIFVVADDWFGTGARAQAEYVISNVDVADELDLHQITYTAASGSESSTTFNQVGTDIQVAASLARAINLGDGGATGLIATTSGTAIVTIKSQQGGTVGNGATFNIELGGTHTGDTTVTGATSDLLDGGGVGSTTPHLAAETTHFFIVADATANPTTSTAQDYDAAKTAMPVDGDTTGLEMISGTVNDEDVEISFEISTEYLTAANAVVTLATVIDGDTVTLDGVTYTGQAGATSGANFQRGLATDVLDADELVDAINGVGGSRVTATNGGGTLAAVTITFDTGGLIGNIVPLVTSDGATLAITGTANAGFLDGGTEYLQNLPYDGALTQNLTFTIACEGV